MTRKKVGPWSVTSEDSIFENPWIQVVDHKVLHPDGTPGEYGVVRFKNIAVGVLPIDENGMTILVGQHRFPLDRYSWELPEGGGPRAESTLASAKRELEEETGLVASSWRELIAFDISNSVTDERAVCYLAWDLAGGTASPEASEELAIKRVRFAELLEMVLNGEITDSLTIVMTLTAHVLALRGGLPEPISRHILAAADRT